MTNEQYRECKNPSCDDALVLHYHKVEKKKTNLLRKPYYQAQDGLFFLNNAVDELLDDELYTILQEVRAKLFEFEVKYFFAKSTEKWYFVQRITLLRIRNKDD